MGSNVIEGKSGEVYEKVLEWFTGRGLFETKHLVSDLGSSISALFAREELVKNTYTTATTLVSDPLVPSTSFLVVITLSKILRNLAKQKLKNLRFVCNSYLLSHFATSSYTVSNLYRDHSVLSVILEQFTHLGGVLKNMKN